MLVFGPCQAQIVMIVVIMQRIPAEKYSLFLCLRFKRGRLVIVSHQSIPK